MSVTTYCRSRSEAVIMTSQRSGALFRSLAALAHSTTPHSADEGIPEAPPLGQRAHGAKV